jgi:hypothetical protein
VLTVIDANEQARVRSIVEKHMDSCMNELSESDFGLGWFPHSRDGYVDAVMAVLRHQVAIDDFHLQEKTSFE